MPTLCAVEFNTTLGSCQLW